MWYSVTLLCIPLGDPPVITTHPMNTNVSLRYGNESATFSCEVNGGGSDIQYAWYTGTGDNSMMIEGATSSEFVLSPVTIEMNGTQYYCVASNNSGSDTSDTAYLTVDYAIGNYCILYFILFSM